MWESPPSEKMVDFCAYFREQGGNAQMAENVIYDYYCGDESNQFSFYRILRQFIIGERFKKSLYGRKTVVRTFIRPHGTIRTEQLADAVKLPPKLDTKGCGLIERARQGQSHPAKIYVKNSASVKSPNFPPHRRRIPEFRKSDASYMESDQTDFSDSWSVRRLHTKG